MGGRRPRGRWGRAHDGQKRLARVAGAEGSSDTPPYPHPWTPGLQGRGRPHPPDPQAGPGLPDGAEWRAGGASPAPVPVRRRVLVVAVRRPLRLLANVVERVRPRGARARREQALPGPVRAPRPVASGDEGRAGAGTPGGVSARRRVGRGGGPNQGLGGPVPLLRLLPAAGRRDPRHKGVVLREGAAEVQPVPVASPPRPVAATPEEGAIRLPSASSPPLLARSRPSVPRVPRAPRLKGYLNHLRNSR